MEHGRLWQRFDAMEARLTAAISERMLELADLRVGQRVLDVATGRGEPAIRAAHRVGRAGSVLGVDIDASVLELARTRADAEGITNLELCVADLSSDADAVPRAAFDVALSRWGVMFMDAPVAALTAIGRALIVGGVLVLAVWADAERVPWSSLPRRVLAQWRPVPPRIGAAAKTFDYAEPARLRADLEAAGLRVQLDEEHETAVVETDDEAELLAWVTAFGGVESVVRTLAEHEREAWEHALVAAVRATNPGGALRLGGVTRLVLATPSRS